MKKNSQRLKKIIEQDRQEVKGEKYKPVKNLLEKNNYKPKFFSISELIRRIKK